MDISKKNNPVAWFEYEPGERYKLRWLSSYELENLKDKIFLSENLIDWEGVKSGEEELICNAKNKRLFAASHAGQQRLIWMVKKAVSLDGWIDIDGVKKK